MPGTGWRNTEYRSFNFAALDHSRPRTAINGARANGHLDDYENATLRETLESRDRRGKVEPQHGRGKQTELFNAAMQGVEIPEKVGKEEDDDDDEEEEEDEEDEEMEGLVRVLTKDTEVADKRSGEAPATHRGGDTVAHAGPKERGRSKSVSVAA